MACGKCHYWGDRGRGMTGPCTAPVEMPDLPVSVTSYPHFQWPPPKSYMSRTDGKGCRLYKAKAGH